MKPPIPPPPQKTAPQNRVTAPHAARRRRPPAASLRGGGTRLPRRLPQTASEARLMPASRPTLVDLPARAASGLVWVYQKTVSPALVVLDPTGGCRFAPACSHYARGAL